MLWPIFSHKKNAGAPASSMELQNNKNLSRYSRQHSFAPLCAERPLKQTLPRRFFFDLGSIWFSPVLSL